MPRIYLLPSLCQVGWRFSIEPQCLTRLWVRETQACGMKRLALQAQGGAATIHLITHQRISA